MQVGKIPIFWYLVALLYFVPSVIAVMRRHHQTAAIVLLDVFLGWTFLGWVAALVWSTTATTRREPAVAADANGWEDGIQMSSGTIALLGIGGVFVIILLLSRL
jgi:hypothetical protein